MPHTHEKTIGDQHVEQVPTNGSIHSGTDSGIVKDPSTTEILAAQDEAAKISVVEGSLTIPKSVPE